MEKPSQRSLTDIDVQCFDASRSIQNFHDLFFVKNTKVDLLKVVFYNSANDFENIPNKAIPYCISKMATEGTPNFSHKQISETVDFWGAYLNTQWGKDFYKVSLLCMPQCFDKIFPIFQEIIRQPTFESERLEYIKDLDLQYLAVENARNKTVLNKEFLQLLFGEKMYGYSRNEADIKSVSSDDLQQCYKDFFKKNWKCIISGNVDDKTLETISSSFNNLLTTEKNSSPAIITASGAPQHKVLEKNLEQEYLCLGKICMPATDKEYPLLWCCVMFLGGYFGSRLMTDIREKGGYTYGIRASLNSMQRCSYLCISCSLKKGFSQKVQEEIQNEIYKLQNELPSNEELFSFQQFFIGEMITELSSPFIALEQFATIDINHLEPNFYSTLAKTIVDLTPEQLSYAAKKFLDPMTMSSVLLQ